MIEQPAFRGGANRNIDPNEHGKVARYIMEDEGKKKVKIEHDLEDNDLNAPSGGIKLSRPSRVGKQGAARSTQAVVTDVEGLKKAIQALT